MDGAGVNTTTTKLIAHARVTRARRVRHRPLHAAVIRRDTQEDTMRTASLRKLTVGAVAAGLVLTGCGTTAEGGSASDGGSEDGPITGLRMMVPNSPGSGYDTTARAVRQGDGGRGVSRATSRSSTSRAPAARSVCSASSTRRATPTCSCRWASASSARSYTNKSEATLDQTTPDRPAHRGGRGDRRPGELAVPDPRRPGGRPGRPTRAARPWAAPPTPAVRTT